MIKQIRDSVMYQLRMSGQFHAAVAQAAKAADKSIQRYIMDLLVKEVSK